jgi:hypothetical protein
MPIESPGLKYRLKDKARSTFRNHGYNYFRYNKIAENGEVEYKAMEISDELQLFQYFQ